ncbi:MAG TPA: AraC family transcriptional regulator, partial [Draconibacterium sp.]|nr:AraC family transcriptional regulator [Draconibacterium sp.]
MKEVNTSNQIFIAKLTEIIELNIANENFGVKELAQAAGMNYFLLNRRLHSILNKNASQFIREIRLQFAKEMLENEEITAAEVAYKAGFGSPAYFNRCFHECFGYATGEIKKKGLIEQKENNNQSLSTANVGKKAKKHLHHKRIIR